MMTALAVTQLRKQVQQSKSKWTDAHSLMSHSRNVPQSSVCCSLDCSIDLIVITIGQKTVYINCSNLFNQLIILAERSEDMRPIFQYELTATPASLFKDRLLRNPEKAALGRLLSKDASATQDSQHPTHVLDGGSLLHHV